MGAASTALKGLGCTLLHFVVRIGRGLVDHLQAVLTPIVLKRVVRLWDALKGLEAAFTVESVTTPAVALTVTYRRQCASL